MVVFFFFLVVAGFFLAVVVVFFGSSRLSTNDFECGSTVLLKSFLKISPL